MDMKSVVALFISVAGNYSVMFLQQNKVLWAGLLLIQNYHSNSAENILNIRQKLCIMKKQNKVYYFRKR